jgi:hypothetical protein
MGGGLEEYIVVILLIVKKVFLIIFLVEHIYACKLHVKASRDMEIGCMGYKE